MDYLLIIRPQSFDGVRRRCLPALYKGLELGTEDDRMKGALWTLNLSTIGTYFSVRGTLLLKLYMLSQVRDWW